MNDCLFVTLFSAKTKKASKLLPQRNGDDSFNGNQNSRSRDENVPVVASTTFEKYGSLVSIFCLLKQTLVYLDIP